MSPNLLLWFSRKVSDNPWLTRSTCCTSYADSVVLQKYWKNRENTISKQLIIQHNPDSATFGNLEYTGSPHLSNPIKSRLPENSDKAILDSSARLTTFEKPDHTICLQDKGVMLEFISNLTAFISSSTQSFYPSKQHKRYVIKGWFHTFFTPHCKKKSTYVSVSAWFDGWR